MSAAVESVLQDRDALLGNEAVVSEVEATAGTVHRRSRSTAEAWDNRRRAIHLHGRRLWLMSAFTLIPGALSLLSAWLKTSVYGHRPPAHYDRTPAVLLGAAFNAQTELVVADACSLACCIFCVLLMSAVRLGTNVFTRKEATGVVQMSALSCTMTLLALLLRHLWGQLPTTSIQTETISGHVTQLIVWILFVKQAGDFVAERTGNTGVSAAADRLQRSGPPQHASDRRIQAAATVWDRDVVEIILAALLAIPALLYPRVTGTPLLGLLSVAVSTACDIVVADKFRRRFSRTTLETTRRQKSHVRRHMAASEPAIMGVLLASIVVPMVLTVIRRDRQSVILEQLWVTSILPLRFLGLTVCHVTITMAAEEEKELLMAVATAQEATRAREAIVQHRTEFLRCELLPRLVSMPILTILSCAVLSCPVLLLVAPSHFNRFFRCVWLPCRYLPRDPQSLQCHQSRTGHGDRGATAATAAAARRK